MLPGAGGHGSPRGSRPRLSRRVRRSMKAWPWALVDSHSQSSQPPHLCQTCPVMSCACFPVASAFGYMSWGAGSVFISRRLRSQPLLENLSGLWQVQAERVAGGTGPQDGQRPWLPAAEGTPREQQGVAGAEGGGPRPHHGWVSLHTGRCLSLVWPPRCRGCGSLRIWTRRPWMHHCQAERELKHSLSFSRVFRSEV